VFPVSGVFSKNDFSTFVSIITYIIISLSIQAEFLEISRLRYIGGVILLFAA